MQKYLPSKKFSIVLVSFALVLVLIYIASNFKKEKPEPIVVDQKKSETLLPSFMNLDTDSDGLKDWEENLWKTDWQKTDTDDDGTGDGDEVKMRRDPLKPNTATDKQEPSDKIISQVTDIREKPTDDFDSLNTTEKMSRELFLQYLDVTSDGSSLTQDEVQEIVDSALSYVPKIAFKTYSTKDISISPLNDNETLRVYTNKVAGEILYNVTAETEMVDDIVADAAGGDSKRINENQITNNFKRFGPLANKNKETIDYLLKMTVPKSFTAEHLALLNSFQEIYESLDLMQKSNNDLIVLVILRNNYSNSIEKLTQAILAMTQKVYTSKIIYKNTSDFGYYLFNDIIPGN